MATTIRITARRDEDVSAEQRGALLRRIVVAGVLIALLIGGLAVFDRSRRLPDEEEEATAPVTEPVTPAPSAALAVSPEETPAVSVQPAALQDAPPPLPEGDVAASAEPSEPAPATTGSRVAAGVAASNTVSPATVAPAVAVPAPARAVAPAVPESTARPGAPAAALEAHRPADRPVRSDAAPVAQPLPVLTRSPAGGYVVQAGVFSQNANAEELRARLALHGIPTQIETRVLVGPFRSRAEADRARAQMRALGLDGAPPVAR